jgi:hypothetical protein
MSSTEGKRFWLGSCSARMGEKEKPWMRVGQAGSSLGRFRIHQAEIVRTAIRIGMTKLTERFMGGCAQGRWTIRGGGDR